MNTGIIFLRSTPSAMALLEAWLKTHIYYNRDRNLSNTLFVSQAWGFGLTRYVMCLPGVGRTQ